MIEPGSWTAHDDLAELADTTPNEVADFLASGKVKLPTSYRVLHADGSIAAEGMLKRQLPGTDLRRRLAAEGIESTPVAVQPRPAPDGGRAQVPAC